LHGLGLCGANELTYHAPAKAINSQGYIGCTLGYGFIKQPEHPGRNEIMSSELSKSPVVHFVGSIPLPDSETVSAHFRAPAQPCDAAA